MKTAVLVAIMALAGASARGLRSEAEYKFLWGQWNRAHGRLYRTQEETSSRYNTFKQNVDRIEQHNSEHHSYTMAVNEFADLTQDEFAARYIGGFRPTHMRGPMDLSLLRNNPVSLPKAVDWISKGAVTPVKNQGQCGSCWAFSATGAMEGAVEIATGKLHSFSEQQLVDCSGSYGNMGCNGGLMDDAFKYIVDNGGLCSGDDYAYTAHDDKCKASSCKPVATITSYKNVPQRNLAAFKAAVAQQPVAVAIQADQYAFQFYSGGVLTGACGTQLNHGVLATGYGYEGNQGYWNIKNSWGASWGEKGYIRFGEDLDAERSSYNNGAGQCGVMAMASYPIA